MTFFKVVMVMSLHFYYHHTLCKNTVLWNHLISLRFVSSQRSAKMSVCERYTTSSSSTYGDGPYSPHCQPSSLKRCFHNIHAKHNQNTVALCL